MLLAGPTASGKSALALRLAEQLGGVIVNADSMQVYRDLRVLTARPGSADETAWPHRLYGHRDGAEGYSVGEWLREFARVRERTPQPLIVVGGTGLYFSALTEGLAEVPPIEDDVRRRWREGAADIGTSELWHELHRRHALSAEALRRGDRQRIIRSLEVLESTGRPLMDWPQGLPQLSLGAGVVGLALLPDRAWLGDRIERRFHRMIVEGAVEEVEALLARRLDPSRPVMRAIGVRELIAMLGGEIDRDRAVELATIATRQYAKRQATWLRNRFGGEWRRAADADEALRIVSSHRGLTQDAERL